ncbi:MAG TPA: CopG family transcriptional regulator [Acidimicrobiia bacterium]|nr:CopG family transcriptional regulator [Acidimicrobiia bacterium]
MRTTIRMDDDLLAAVKAEAASSGQTLTAFIEEAAHRQLASRRAATDAPTPDLPVFAGDGLLPGVDLDDSAALRDLMEGR